MARTFEFGPFRLEVATRRLLKAGEPVPLTPKAFDVLLALVERRDRVVDKDELLRLVWPGVVVEESNLSQTIFVLRKALGEDADGRQFVDTVPRRGYRFAGDVRDDADSAARRRWRAPAAVLVALAVLAMLAVGALILLQSRDRGEPIRSIAVLPLANLSGEPSEAYFVDGLTDALTTELAQVSALRVVSRSSTLAYRGTPKPSAVVGRELGIDAFIEGSILRSGDRVRVTVQLIHAPSDRHLWARSFERRIEDVLDLQREIVRTIADEVSAALTPAERMRFERSSPVDARALDEFLLGRHEHSKRSRQGYIRAIEHYEKATALDPKLAEAYAGIADAYMGLAGYLHAAPHEVIPRAKAVATRALELYPDLGDAHASLGNIIWRYEYDWPHAEAEFRRAIELNPNSAQSHHLYALGLTWAGRTEDAVRMIERARLLDPLSLGIQTSAAWIHYFARDYARAIADFDRILSIDPVNVMAFRRRGWAYQMQGRHAEAIASFERARTLSNGDIIETAALGRGYAMAGRRDDALQIVAELRRRDPAGDRIAYSLAEIHTALGDVDEALKWLERAHEVRSIWYVFVKTDPAFDRLRGDPRFADLVNRVKW
jgi:TolB-like protein/DNA-binding winged helix-turn-helix (wHTH) protein/Flp pilus assembly protein TadD